MDLKSDKQQNIQTELDFSSRRAGEACGTGREETESQLAAFLGKRRKSSPQTLAKSAWQFATGIDVSQSSKGRSWLSRLAFTNAGRPASRQKTTIAESARQLSRFVGSGERSGRHYSFRSRQSCFFTDESSGEGPYEFVSRG
jgi:hypothetical protein